MEWVERLNQAVNYIEENLSGTIQYDVAAQLACCSTFHFQRMFSYISGIPLSEYIRRRRMSAAAVDLQTTRMKIIDIALQYGYESPTSFNRAFQSVHGISPSAARAKGVPLKAFPRISITISIKGDVEMNYKIEQKEAFRIVGVRERMEMEMEGAFARVPVFWQETFQAGMIPKILEMLNQPPYGLLGISTSMNSTEFDYYIAVATDKPALQGMSEFEVPACTWAVFECIGPMPQAIQELQKRIITEWLPTSGYEYANAPDIEVYTEGDQQSPSYRSEVWLPVVRKQ